MKYTEMVPRLQYVEKHRDLLFWFSLMWDRTIRQIFWLTEGGTRSIARICELLGLTRPEDKTFVEQVSLNFWLHGYFSMRIERMDYAMNPALLKESFELIRPNKEAFAHVFYIKLFEKHPEAVLLFQKTDMPELEKKLMETLAYVIAGILDIAKDPQEPTPVLERVGKLGAKHAHMFHVTHEHYAWVGEALVATLQQFLGEKFTSDVKDAWLQAYTIISKVMLYGTENPIVYGSEE